MHGGDDLDASLFGMPAESDWVLGAPFMDRSLLRNPFAYDLSRAIGLYAPRTAFAELFLNDDGASNIGTQHYRGVYVFTEKVEPGPERVDIGALAGSDTSGSAISGGYLVEWTIYTRLKDSERWFETPNGAILNILYPKPDDLTSEQELWISQYVAEVEEAFDSPNDDYEDLVEVGTFVDYFLVNELLRNHDAFIASTFMSKKREGKLRMGPVWDFDHALGDVKYDGDWSSEGFMLLERPWASSLLKKPSFLETYRARWRQLRQGVFGNEAMLRRIDAAVAQLKDSPSRNFEKWRVLGRYVKANRAPYSSSFEEEIDKMKGWLVDRADWMDAHINEL